MKKLLLLFLLFIGLPMAVVSAKDKDPYRYEIEGTGYTPTTAGYIIIKVWNYGRRELATSDKCLRSAIEGLLFKGYEGVGNDRGKQALIPDGINSNKDYFDNFFSSGDYKQYVQFSNNGEPDDVIKLSSKQYKYKVGMLVMVNYSALQKRLEKDGLIKSAKSVFEKAF